VIYYDFLKICRNKLKKEKDKTIVTVAKSLVMVAKLPLKLLYGDKIHGLKS
jgi:hypothetical protein